MSKTIKWVKPIKANFQSDLAKGRIGELALLHATGGTLTPTDGRTGDFVITGTRIKVEVKSDGYDIDKTPNLFIEKYSYGNKPGGCYQALEHGCKYFVYIFAKSGDLFCFETRALVDRINLLHDSVNLKLTDVPNPNYTTRGLKVNRDLITDLMLEPKDIGIKYDSDKYKWYINYNRATP